MREFILRTYTDDESETCKECGLQEVVRCKDCKHYINGYCYSDNFVLRFEEVKPDWFCADGERRENA